MHSMRITQEKKSHSSFRFRYRISIWLQRTNGNIQ